MGLYLSEPKTEKETVTGGNNKYTFCATGMQGWRMNMEDAHISQVDIDEDTHIFGVFDGHGGREVAKFVSVHFIRELRGNPEYKKGNYEEALKQTFMKMDILLMDEKNKKELMGYKENNDYEESMAGCTANVVLIKGDTLYCANAGDTRCCISHNGTLVKMSKDHKPDDPLEKQRITDANGTVSDGRVNGNLNLSRALGDLEQKKNKNLDQTKQLIIALPDIKKRKFQKGDEFIIVGCDGIWETQSSEEIISWTKKSLQTREVKETAEKMLDWLIAPDTQNGAGCDNMSVILIKLLQ